MNKKISPTSGLIFINGGNDEQVGCGKSLIYRIFFCFGNQRLPKPTSFDTITEEEIAYVENWINNRPMKINNQKT